MQTEYPYRDVTALVLAGGRGTRMGGRDKGLLAYRGKPLVEWVSARLAGQSARVLVSANRSIADYRALGMTTLPDLRPDFPGPLGGIEAGFAACETGYLLVCPCDTPHVPEDLGPRLWQAMQEAAAELAYACDPERDHYLHVLLPASLADDLRAYLDQGGRAVRHWLSGKRVARAAFEQDELRNINEPDALR